MKTTECETCRVRPRELSFEECEALTQKMRDLDAIDYLDVRDAGEEMVLDGCINLADLEKIVQLWKAAIA